MLHCTHHICHAHLDQLQTAKQGLVPCPVCGDVTQVPDTGLPIDTSLQLVLEYFEEKQSQPKAAVLSGSNSKVVPMCGFCEEQPADRRCVQCDGVLCEACAISSHSKGFFQESSDHLIRRDADWRP